MSEAELWEMFFEALSMAASVFSVALTFTTLLALSIPVSLTSMYQIRRNPNLGAGLS